jgi:hypothetical protein
VFGQVCLVEDVCLQCQGIDILTPEGVCVNHCTTDDAFRVFKKQVKQKEEAIARLLRADGGRVTRYQMWSADKIIPGSSSKCRPDFVYRWDNFVLIIEVDEFQHKNTGYSVDAERARMFEVASAFPECSVQFIRYNPDAYQANAGSAQADENQRHETLLRWVNQAMDDSWQPFSGIAVKYLFYDHYDETDASWSRLDAPQDELQARRPQPSASPMSSSSSSSTSSFSLCSSGQLQAAVRQPASGSAMTARTVSASSNTMASSSSSSSSSGKGVATKLASQQRRPIDDEPVAQVAKSSPLPSTPTPTPALPAAAPASSFKAPIKAAPKGQGTLTAFFRPK